MNKTRKHIFIKSVFLLLAVILCCVQVLALAPIDTGAPCKLDVRFVPEGIKAVDVPFRLYKVASVSDSGKYTPESKYNIEGIAGLLQNPSAEGFSLIASTVAGMIDADSSMAPAAAAVTGAEGIATFENLPAGLYFVTGENYRTGNTCYMPQDYLVQVPGRGTADTWVYYVLSDVKWTKYSVTDKIDVKVIKTWTDSASNLHANDFVTVELYRNGVIFDKQILKKDNSWTFVWTGLNAADRWTIKEIGIPGYTGTLERQGETFIVTNKPSGGNTPPPPLPQTGLLWWPVPILLALGTLFTGIGLSLKKKEE